jgi:hypothetical protein
MRRQAVATSPPLGGASEYFHGRSSDFAGSFLLAGLPRTRRFKCHLGLSYLLTAAGQFRNFTGFPFHSPRGETVECLPYLWQSLDASPWVVDKRCPNWFGLPERILSLGMLLGYRQVILDLLATFLRHRRRNLRVGPRSFRKAKEIWNIRFR